jgi:hypothetical protein
MVVRTLLSHSSPMARTTVTSCRGNRRWQGVNTEFKVRDPLQQRRGGCSEQYVTRRPRLCHCPATKRPPPPSMDEWTKNAPEAHLADVAVVRQQKRGRFNLRGNITAA